MKLLGTPLGTPAYVQKFLNDKAKTQDVVIEHIERVAAQGHSREAVQMLT